MRITIALLLISVSAYAQLTKEELKILKNVEKDYEQSVSFLEKTVNINSGTYNVDGVRKVGIIYKEFLDQLGFTTKWVDMPSNMKRAGHLIGEIKGKKGKRLLLIGHIDTVFEPESNFLSWNRKDSLAWGPGVNDMKGGNMVMLYALK